MKRILSLALCIFLLSSIFTASVFAEETEDAEYVQAMEELNAQKEAATENRKNAQTKVEQLKEAQSAAIEEKMALEERNDAALNEIEVIKKQIELINKEIYEYERKIELKAQEVDDAKDKEETQLGKYKARIRAMEENSSYNILAFILDSDSLDELLASLDDYKEIMDSDKALYDSLVEAREKHETVKKEYTAYKEKCEEKKSAYEKSKAELELEQQELEKQIEESEQLIDEYTEKIKEAEEEQKAMEAAESAAASAAANYIAQYNAAKNAKLSESIIQENSSVTEDDSSVAETQQSDSGITTYEGSSGNGAYIWPFPNHFIVTSPFGYRSSTSSFHTGIDIDGYQSMGSPIVAADSGTVILSQYYGGYGNCIIIDHGNGYSTLYAHLSSMNVSCGDSVSQGTTIGGVGNTGTCYGIDGIHLHFEIIQNGTQVDPLPYLSSYSYTLY